MRAERCYTLNEEKEIRVGNCFFTKVDITLMYIDGGKSIEELAKNLGVGRKKATKILNKFGIPKSQQAKMTPRRLRVLRYIAYHQQRYKRSPLIKEIADKLLIPSCSVVYHIKKLIEFGYIAKQKHDREIKITEKGRRWCKHTTVFNIHERKEENKKCTLPN